MGNLPAILLVILSVVLISGCVQQGPLPGPAPGTPGEQPGAPNQPPQGAANPPPGGQQGEDGGFRFPPLDVSGQPAGPPVSGEAKSIKLNGLEISYYSVAASYTLYSPGVDFLMHVKNGGGAGTFHIRNSLPPTWNLHFFQFHPGEVTLGPGEETTLHYFAAMDGPGEFNIDFDLWQAEDLSDKVTASVKFYSASMEE